MTHQKCQNDSSNQRQFVKNKMDILTQIQDQNDSSKCQWRGFSMPKTNQNDLLKMSKVTVQSLMTKKRNKNNDCVWLLKTNDA